DLAIVATIGPMRFQRAFQLSIFSRHYTNLCWHGDILPQGTVYLLSRSYAQSAAHLQNQRPIHIKTEVVPAFVAIFVPTDNDLSRGSSPDIADTNESMVLVPAKYK